MDEGQTFGGLGYSENNGQTHQQDSNCGTGAVAGDMLKQLMQQCLAYHEQQQQQQEQNHPQLADLPVQGEQNQNFGAKNDLQNDDGPYGFKAGGEERMEELSKNCSIEPGIPQTITVNNNSHEVPPVRNLQSVVEEGRSRANAILEKFQQLTREHGMMGDVQQGGDTEAFTAPSEFREKREKFFEKENERKHKFLLKNLEYVGNLQTQRLQQTLSQLDEAKQYEHQMEGQYRAMIEQRKERLSKSKHLNSEAGIGTAKRQRVEREKTRKGHVPSSNTAPETSLAVYLSGLPTDGSFQEDTLHQLFRSYGKIRKIHPYRNKQTGELKGDALIIYQVKKGEEDELLRTVCSQMNGAELPSGSVLQVQPADSNYKEKEQKQTHYGPGGNSMNATTNSAGQEPQNNGKGKNAEDQQGGGDNAVASESKPESGVADDDDEDLDDFFESLT